jgi:hypothetical protein
MLRSDPFSMDLKCCSAPIGMTRKFQSSQRKKARPGQSRLNDSRCAETKHGGSYLGQILIQQLNKLRAFKSAAERLDRGCYIENADESGVFE